jgi:fused signal recognition particle receptor
MFGRRKKTGAQAPESGKKAPNKGLGRRILDLISRSGGNDEDLYDHLEDLLVEADFGASAAVGVVEELRKARRDGSGGRDDLVSALKEILRPSLSSTDLTPAPGKLSLYLVLGVNGVGKTTTIAKMAYRFGSESDGGIVFAAGDTFRAAAIEQLEIHAQRVGARVVRQDHGSDPGAVVYDAIASARSRGDRLVLADTAGRMHNRANLVKELEKVDRIARDRLSDDGVYRKVLVIDATTGQNGMRQAETFHEAIGVDAVVMTKYDSSAKGGLVAAISRQLGLPFAYLGKGEGMDDLVPFDPDEYLEELLPHGDA